MAVDYIVNLPCKVKETLSTDGMVALIKQRYRAVAAIEAIKGNTKSDEQALGATFQIMLAAPGGVRAVDVQISELLAGTEKLDRLQAYCACCPASAGRPFGCYRTLSYPISRKAEEWLAATAGKAAALPGELVAKEKVEGGVIGEMRADPDGEFFELRRPVVVRGAAGPGPQGCTTVSTDGLFNLMLGRQRLREDLIKKLIPLSGGLTVAKEEPDPATYQVAFQARAEDGAPSWWAFCLEDEPYDDASTGQLKQFFRMMAVALALRRDITVSL